LKTLTRSLIAATALASTLGITAFAADGPHDKAIEARQHMFQLYNFNSGILGAMAKGKMEYNPAIATEAAENLSALAMLGQSQFWPMGSDNATEGNARTRALPVIWETFPAIIEKADALKAAAEALVPVAGQGLDAMKSAYGDVGQACKGCHTEFRARGR